MKYIVPYNPQIAEYKKPFNLLSKGLTFAKDWRLVYEFRTFLLENVA
jgi:hypothetical protein